MNFQDFVAALPALRSRHPAALDLTDTRVCNLPSAAVLADAIENKMPAVGYRCHIAKAWRAGLPERTNSLVDVFISQGVRHSLTVLFTELAKKGLSVALPADVYPVYLRLALDAGLTPVTFPTMEALTQATLPNADWLLVANPLKPRGGYLQPTEVQVLLAWLSVSSKRRVVVDAVYDLNPALDASTQLLVDSGQVVVLHSLSKRFLAPLRAGMAAFPLEDAPAWSPLFYSQPVDRDMLAQAEAYLGLGPEASKSLAEDLSARQAALVEYLELQGIPLARGLDPKHPSYLIPVALPLDDLARAGILGVPFTAFGGADSNITIVSSIGFGAKVD